VCDRHFYPECGGDTFLPDAGDHSWRVGGMLSAHTLTTWLHEKCSGSHVSLSVRVYHKLQNNSLLSKASRALATEPSRWSKLLIAYGTEQLLVVCVCFFFGRLFYDVTVKWTLVNRRGQNPHLTRDSNPCSQLPRDEGQPATGTSSMYMCSAANDKGSATQKVMLGTSTSSSKAFKLTVL
jgi:hypothetical protein